MNISKAKLSWILIVILFDVACASRSSRDFEIISAESPEGRTFLKEIKTQNSKIDRWAHHPEIRSHVMVIDGLAKKIALEVGELAKILNAGKKSFSLTNIEQFSQDPSILSFADELKAGDLSSFIFTDEYDSIMINEKIGSSYTYRPKDLDGSQPTTEQLLNPDLASRTIIIAGSIAAAQSLLVYGQPLNYPAVRATAQLVLGATLVWFGVRASDGNQTEDELKAVPFIVILTGVVKSINTGISIRRSMNMITTKYNPEDVLQKRAKIDNLGGFDTVSFENIKGKVSVSSLKSKYANDPETLKQFDVMVPDDMIEKQVRSGVWPVDKIGLKPAQLKKMIGVGSMLAALIGAGITFNQLNSASKEAKFSLAPSDQAFKFKDSYTKVGQLAAELRWHKLKILDLVYRLERTPQKN